MKKQKNSLANQHELLTAEDILGKEVIDPTGAIVGIADALYIDPKTFTMTGISVDRGLLDTGLIVGKALIKTITEHAILLTQQPLPELVGKNAYDKEGILLGKIHYVELEEDKNTLVAFVIKSGRDKLVVHPSDIQRIGKGIFLKKTKADIWPES